MYLERKKHQPNKRKKKKVKELLLSEQVKLDWMSMFNYS